MVSWNGTTGIGGREPHQPLSAVRCRLEQHRAFGKELQMSAAVLPPRLALGRIRESFASVLQNLQCRTFGKVQFSQ